MDRKNELNLRSVEEMNEDVKGEGKKVLVISAFLPRNFRPERKREGEEEEEEEKVSAMRKPAND